MNLLVVVVCEVELVGRVEVEGIFLLGVLRVQSGVEWLSKRLGGVHDDLVHLVVVRMEGLEEEESRERRKRVNEGWR